MLHALREYGEKLGGEPGFKTREVRWAIQLTESGELLNVVPLGDDRSGMQLPRCADMHAMNSGGKAHFLVETAQFVACYFKPNEEAAKIVSAEGRHRYFRSMLSTAAEAVPVLKPVSALLENPEALEKLNARLAEKKAKPADWVTWQVGGSDLSQLSEVQGWWRTWRTQDLATTKPTKAAANGNMVCLLTGELVEPLQTHRPITGLAGLGGLAMGDVMVGFDKSAFKSYGLDKSANASMSSNAAQQYVDALNYLIQQRQTLAGAAVVYWFKEAVAPEDDLFAMLRGMETEEQKTASALSQARQLLTAIRSGERAELGHNHYYAMTISGASGRVMVRDWLDGQFDALLESTIHWFDTLEIVGLTGNLAPTQKLETTVTSLLPEKSPQQKYSDWVKPIGSARRDLWHVALNKNLSMPATAFARCVAETNKFMVSETARDIFFPARQRDQSGGNGFSVARLYARMGLIKAYFIRQSTGGALHMKPHLNPEHPAPAYHCGRLLAVLAKLQHAALGDVGAGVVQRYYPAASSAPGLTLGRLIGNARNHLGKIEYQKKREEFDELLEEVISTIGDSFPRTLDLEGQGLFALGYYQQLAALRAPKKETKDNNQSGDQQ